MRFSVPLVLHVQRTQESRLMFGCLGRVLAVTVLAILGGVALVVAWAHHTGRLYEWVPSLAPAMLSIAGEGVLIRVVDGDTVVVRYHDLPLHVRLRSIDTAESVHPDPERNTARGRETSAWAKNHLDGARVRIEFQRRGWAIATDRNGRALADLWIDRGPPGPDPSDELYAETVIASGLSRYITSFGPSERYDARLQSAEDAARRQRLGLWAGVRR